MHRQLGGTREGDGGAQGNGHAGPRARSLPTRVLDNAPLSFMRRLNSSKEMVPELSLSMVLNCSASSSSSAVDVENDSANSAVLHTAPRHNIRVSTVATALRARSCVCVW